MTPEQRFKEMAESGTVKIPFAVIAEADAAALRWAQEEIASLRDDLTKQQETTASIRASHRTLCHAIKKALGIKNWPPIPGPFQEGVGLLVESRLAAAEEMARALEPLAEFAKAVGPALLDSFVIVCGPEPKNPDVTLGHCRRAASALEKWRQANGS